MKDLNFKEKNTNLIAVKKPVFPFNKFPNQNIFLSPEMKSTGEVIGFDKHLGSAYAKAEYGSGNSIPLTEIFLFLLMILIKKYLKLLEILTNGL